MKLSQFIAHIVVDDKFIDMAVREFEAVAPGANRWMILGRKRPLRFVKSAMIDNYSIGAAKALINSNECGAVVFHSLPDATILPQISRSKRVVWLGWGYDYYDRLLAGAYPNGLLLPETRSLMCQAPAASHWRAFRARARVAINRALGRSVPFCPEMLSRVDIFSPVIDIEFHLIRELNPWFRPIYVPWNYGTVEDDLLENSEIARPLGRNILVGNSASPENNHLEVFRCITQHVCLTDRKIVVPLSYGNEWYKRRLIAIGREMFGDQFVPLTDFMPKSAYFRHLQSCGHVFMNHIRQQALGNLCIMMLKGASIYMNPESPLYRWLIEKGAVIRSISTLNRSTAEHTHDLPPLAASEQAANAAMIRAHWGQRFQRAKTRELVDIALGIA